MPQLLLLVLRFEPVPQPLGCRLTSCIARQSERFGDGWTEEGVTERIQHQRERALGDVVGVMANRELRDETPDGVQYRVQRVPVAGKNHPGRERAGALAAKCVEALVDDKTRVGLAGTCALDRFGDPGVHGVRDRPSKLALEARSGAEVMKEVRVSAADLCRHRLQSHRLRPLVEQQLTRRSQRGGSAFFGGEARASY